MGLGSAQVFQRQMRYTYIKNSSHIRNFKIIFSIHHSPAIVSSSNIAMQKTNNRSIAITKTIDQQFMHKHMALRGHSVMAQKVAIGRIFIDPRAEKIL